MSLGRAPIKQWDERASRKHDTARPGCASELEVMRRSAWVESAVLRGQKAVTILWDIQKFYDNMSVDSIATSAKALRFPMRSLALALPMYRSGRRLQNKGAVSREISRPSRSAVAGCAVAPSLARAVVTGMLAEVVEEGVEQFNHVDDVTQIIIGPTTAEVVYKAVRAGKDLSRQVHDQGYRVSSKSAVLASEKRGGANYR